ncbi:MAG: polysaccharide biosynthesis protein [Sphingomonadales bacterium]|jgi:FlaA1/EpsC-like NDP-sugar epimerase|nr:polysaccharide biosynthesis protein [Sphingomonadales bacterium]MBK9431518.1 polysaccharide biosynthesis protein [Sphingomonadales bacterium]
MLQGPSEKILGLSRPAKRAFALAIDTALCLMTVAIAYWLRLGDWTPPTGNQLWSYGLPVVLAIPLFVRFGLYRAIFRYVGWGALFSVVKACAIFGFIYAAIFTVIGFDGVPRTIGIIQPILLFLAIGASRVTARFWLGGGYQSLLRLSQRKRVLIYGAGSAGRQLAAGLANSEDMNVVGFVDDDISLHASVLNGKTIYPSTDLLGLIESFDIAILLLAIPSASRQRRNEIIDSMRGSHASIRTLPGMTDLAHGRVTVNDLRELEIEELLGRDPVAPDPALLAQNLFEKTVLVSGAGGSIGSELCRQILRENPKNLLLLERSEYNLYTIHQELAQKNLEDGITTNIVPLLTSVLNEQSLEALVGEWRPDTIFHAAAYKHVPLVEHNAIEGIRNNVFGTLALAKSARKHKVADFVLISTDKAVRPTNIMGASKRLAELILQAFALENPATRFSMVRFGNVLGSSGSVVPLFRQQIKQGGPVTVTHEEITRYFMTIPEAAQLVIQAGTMARGGEVFVLDMGEPVKIIELARTMIELSGLSVRDDTNPEGDVAVEVTGLRDGEKLYEELLIGDNPEPTAHSRIMKANEDFLEWCELETILGALASAMAANDADTLRTTIKAVTQVGWREPDGNGSGRLN